MVAKKLLVLVVVSACVAWLGAKAWADESSLSEMDPEMAKEFGGKITELFTKAHKDLPVKINADAEKAVGLVDTDTNEGIILVPLKGFREESEAQGAEKNNGIGLCYVFMTPTLAPLTDGKPTEAKNLHTVKVKDSDGNEHEAVCLMCAVKHVEGDDWQLQVYSAAKEPLAKASFEEATDAPQKELALTIKDVKDKQATLVINLFGKYCVNIPISHKQK